MTETRMLGVSLRLRISREIYGNIHRVAIPVNVLSEKESISFLGVCYAASFLTNDTPIFQKRIAGWGLVRKVV
jgi:hypothetical protein